jgi:hypothetical protein
VGVVVVEVSKVVDVFVVTVAVEAVAVELAHIQTVLVPTNPRHKPLRFRKYLPYLWSPGRVKNLQMMNLRHQEIGVPPAFQKMRPRNRRRAALSQRVRRWSGQVCLQKNQPLLLKRRLLLLLREYPRNRLKRLLMRIPLSRFPNPR